MIRESNVRSAPLAGYHFNFGNESPAGFLIRRRLFCAASHTHTHIAGDGLWDSRGIRQAARPGSPKERRQRISMASGQPSGVPLPSRKTVSGPNERPPLRTRRKNVAPNVGRRAQYLLMCFGTFYVWLEMKFWPRRIFFADYHQAEARAAPAPSSLISLAEFCGSAGAKLQKGKTCLAAACVFLLRRSHGAHSECESARVLFTMRRC